MTGLKTVIVMVASMGLLAKETGMVLLEIEDKAEEMLEDKGRGQGLTKVQMLDAQE